MAASNPSSDSKRLQQVLKNAALNALKIYRAWEVGLQDRASTFRVEPQPGSCEFLQWRQRFRSSRYGHRHCADRNSPRHFRQMAPTSPANTAALGLSISREIARLLAGEIQLVRSPGSGARSRSTCRRKSYFGAGEGEMREMYIQILFSKQLSSASPAFIPLYSLLSALPSLTDDRGSIQPGDRVLLIVDDDVNFAMYF